jgi:hypothetical protein
MTLRPLSSEAWNGAWTQTTWIFAVGSAAGSGRTSQPYRWRFGLLKEMRPKIRSECFGWDSQIRPSPSGMPAPLVASRSAASARRMWRGALALASQTSARARPDRASTSANTTSEWQINRIRCSPLGPLTPPSQVLTVRSPAGPPHNCLRRRACVAQFGAQGCRQRLRIRPHRRRIIGSKGQDYARLRQSLALFRAHRLFLLRYKPKLPGTSV